MEGKTTFQRLRLWAVSLLLLAGLSAQVFGLDTSLMQCMVIVEGDGGQGRGSAFIVRMEGRLYVVSNAHVVRGQKVIKYKTLSNTELKVGPLEIADNADLVRAELKTADHVLEMAVKEEQFLKIGDEVVVAGNSEGAGVVRELPGKLTGIGPDRIEVDATVVPGNSGSPILLKSTGRVIGVATYLQIPPWLWGGSRSGSTYKSPLSLNEVRRFGYRLDTVGKWVKSSPADRIAGEGIKLDRLDESASVLMQIVYAGTAALVKNGAGRYVSKEHAEANPGLRPLVEAVEEFTTKSRVAKLPDENKENFLKLFDRLKAAVTNEVKGLKPESYSGFFGKQLKEHLEWRKQMYTWLETTAAEGAKNSWTVSGAPFRWGGLTDPATLNLILTHDLDPAGPAERRHRVSYGVQFQPSNLEFIFWVVENPLPETNATPMTYASFRVPTPTNGTYRVYAEYRGPGLTRKVSNVLEFNAADAAEPGGIKPGDPATQALFTKGVWSGEVKLPPGAYQQKGKLVLGGETPAHVVSVPKTVISSGSEAIMVREGDWKAEGTLFRNSNLQCFMNGKFEAKDSLFENCGMTKTGPKAAKFFTAKWSFENCVFSRSFIKLWSTTAIGVKAQNCTFYAVNFFHIDFREDAGAEVQKDWMTIKNCRFVDCRIPESFLITTKDCVFENCTFGPPEEKLLIRTPAKTRIYLVDRKETPTTGQDRSVEILDATQHPGTAGATLPHVRAGISLKFTDAAWVAAPVAERAADQAISALPLATDQTSLERLEDSEEWTGDITLAPGRYAPKQRIGVGKLKPNVPGRVTTGPRTQIEGTEIVLRTGAWQADGTLFKDLKFTTYLGTEVNARNSLFESCTMHKGGGAFQKFFSTKWVFENCVFTKGFIKPWKTTDIGVRVRDCTFYDVDFAPVQYREDAGKEAHNENFTLTNCRFVGCEIPESLLVATRDCVFENCTFGPPEGNLPIQTPLSTRAYVTDRRSLPATGANRTVEILDATKQVKAGATVEHVRSGEKLGFK